MKYFEKTSEDKYENLGFVDSMKAVTAAGGRKKSGPGRVVANNELIGSRVVNSTVGGIGGALAGLGVSALASKNPSARMLGTVAGAFIGHMGGVYKADKDYLTKRGIKPRSSYLLTGKVSINPEAKKKYLNK